MFEKELEEYKNQPKWKGKIFMKDEETCFKDGLELGYNKANEWHKQDIDDIYDFIAEDWSVKERKQLFELPNWDNKVFEKITGIDAETEIAKEIKQ